MTFEIRVTEIGEVSNNYDDKEQHHAQSHAGAFRRKFGYSKRQYEHNSYGYACPFYEPLVICLTHYSVGILSGCFYTDSHLNFAL